MTNFQDLAEIAWTDLSVEHIGRSVHIQWPSPERYSIGEIAGIGSDSISVTVYLGYGADYSWMHGKPNSPTLFLLPLPAGAKTPADQGRSKKSAWTIAEELQ